MPYAAVAAGVIDAGLLRHPGQLGGPFDFAGFLELGQGRRQDPVAEDAGGGEQQPRPQRRQLRPGAASETGEERLGPLTPAQIVDGDALEAAVAHWRAAATPRRRDL